jgi:regulator of cell morphogenesis and NO signaling
LEVFLAFCNLYNGFNPSGKENYTLNDVSVIIQFLENSHTYYKQDKYPEIRDFIKQLHLKNDTDEIKLIEKFFNEYFEEVTEHLDYEEEVAFPYFCELVNHKTKKDITGKNKFSVKEYKEHHSDIESKLGDLKNLLLKHISLKNDHVLRRKLLFSLFELEFDLNIHSLIEEMILIPIVYRIESINTNG